MIGTRLGPYEIIEEIGRGGMATVYRAYQPSTGRFVAIKVIHRSIAGDPRAVERFQREAKLITRLEHPHLLPIYDYDGTHEPPYIVMRYLESGTLKDVLDVATLPLAEVAYVMRQLTSALDYAHRQGVIHRDIKPSNIMVDQDGNSFLMDFGIARMTEGATQGLTQTGLAVGTPGYMAPEQGMGREHIDHRVDIYALGVMLFQMVTGQMPYTAETPIALVFRHINDPIPSAVALNDMVPPEVDDVIAQAMAKEPEERFQSASDFSDALTRAIGKISGNVRPNVLRKAASDIAARIQAQRSGQQDEIDATMAAFEESRMSPGARRSPQPQERRTPTQPISAQVPVPHTRRVGRGLSPTGIAAGVVVVLLAAIVVLLALQGNQTVNPGIAAAPSETDTPAQPTNTEVPLVVLITNTAPPAVIEAPSATPTEAPSATDTAAPTDTDTAAPTETPSETDTEAPVETAAVVAQGVTETPSDTATTAPSETATDMPTDTPSDTATDTATTTPSETPTETPVPTETPTDTPTETPIPTETPTDTPTETAIPSDTPTPEPTNTPQPTNTPLPSETPTPAEAMAQIQRGLTLRGGPGSQYPAVATVEANTTLNITGISDDGAWFQVVLPDGQLAWLSTSPLVVNAQGNLADVPMAVPPTETPTLTPSDTPTRTPTPTETFTPSNTPTDTPTNTLTPSDTPTPTDTLTPSHTPTDTPTLTPSETPTPTYTLTPTPTVTPSLTPTPTHTPTPLATATPTPLPTEIAAALRGNFPYVADFETDMPLEGWDFEAEKWRVVEEGGEHYLMGQANLQQPMVILGTMSPEWLTTPDIAVRYRFNLAPNSGGARLVFRYNDQGYNVVEVLPGQLSLRRGAGAVDLAERTGEQALVSQRAEIQANRWHELTVWVDSMRIFVYLDNKLAMATEDTSVEPQAGAIMLQVNGDLAPVRFDDLIILKPEAPSTHFNTAQMPPTWSVSNPANAGIDAEGDGNQFLRMQEDALAAPTVEALSDLRLVYRHYLTGGGYQLLLREGNEGRVILDLTAGMLTVTVQDAAGNAIQSFRGVQFYNRSRWEDVVIELIGNNLRVLRDGEVKFDAALQGAPAAGGVAFIARRQDIVGLDDVLITAAQTSSNILARQAYALRDAILARPYRELRSDMQDNFENIYLTEPLWINGRQAAGQFSEDPTAADHKLFLRMSHGGAPTFRMLRDVWGVEIFRSGSDTVNFSNSTDILASVDVRFPPGLGGTAWINARSVAAGDSIAGYELALRRDPDGTTTAIARYVSPDGETVFFEGAAPDVEPGSDAWINLTIFTLRDQVYFFANNQFIALGDGTLGLGGTAALGVESLTTADFDSFLIRDTSPHDA